MTVYSYDRTATVKEAAGEVLDEKGLLAAAGRIKAHLKQVTDLFKDRGVFQDVINVQATVRPKDKSAAEDFNRAYVSLRTGAVDTSYFLDEAVKAAK